MDIKKMLFTIGLCVIVFILLVHEGSAQQTRPRPGSKAPVLTNAYMVDRGQYGKSLKIYMEAEDPEGDMSKIAVSVTQVGYGHYPTDFIILKPQYRKSFRGYLQWNTFSSKASFLEEWTRITVKVSVFDKAGNISNEVELPFTFETGAGGEAKPPAPFDQGNLPKLGNVFIDLYNPSRMGGGEVDIN